MEKIDKLISETCMVHDDGGREGSTWKTVVQVFNYQIGGRLLSLLFLTSDYSKCF